MSAPACPMPPNLSPDDEKKLLSNARDIAEIIHYDMHQMSSLLDQQSKLACDDGLLQRALPLETLDSGNATQPSFLTELLPFEGDYSEFCSMLRASIAAVEQDCTVVAVTQASGSGKTKLAYAQGLNEDLVIFIRVAQHASADVRGGVFAGPWPAFLELYENMMPGKASTGRANTSVCRSNSKQTALMASRLVAVAYVLWVAMVLQEYASINMAAGGEPRKAPTEYSPQAARYREVALRCLRSNRGADAVATIYFKLLGAFKDAVSSPSAADAILRPKIDIVKNYLAELHKFMRTELLWPGAHVTIWFDEAHRLLQRGRIFTSSAEYTERNNGRVIGIIEPLSSGNDAFDTTYGLTALMWWLIHEVGWSQVICGPSLELSDCMKPTTFACVNTGITSYDTASRITPAEMTSSIQRFFKVELTPQINNQLEKLTGRPKWFYNHFWPSLWSKIQPYWAPIPPAHSNLTKEILVGLIQRAADEAVEECNEAAISMIRILWLDKAEDARWVPSSGALCRELYAAIKMNAGVATVVRAASTAVAIECGLLTLTPDCREVTINLHDEPPIAAALEKYGDHQVVEARNLGKLDPVEALFLLEMNPLKTRLSSFDMTRSVQGPLFELCFVWHIIKAALVNETALTLKDVFAGLLPHSFELPDHVATRVLTASRAVSAQTIREMPQYPMGFSLFFEEKYKNCVVYNATSVAGMNMNVGFAASVDGDSTDRVLVSIHFQAKVYPSLEDCLTAATPAWQFVIKPLRTGVVSNVWSSQKPEVCKQRRQFEELTGANPDFFYRAVRVAMSAIEFQPESIAACNALNSTDNHSSPVVLSAITDDCSFPLAKQLRAALMKKSMATQVEHTDKWAYWLPHNTAEVTRAVLQVGTLNSTLSAAATAAVREHFPSPKRPRQADDVADGSPAQRRKVDGAE